MGLVYEFDGFQLDPRRRRFARANGDVVPLAPRTFDVLHALVRQPGELVDKAALMKALWPKVVVSDNSLDQIISRLRRSLAERGAPHSFISTERGRGYRFSADVRAVDVADDRSLPPNDLRNIGAGAQPAERLYAQALTLSVRPSPENLSAALELLETALTLNPRFARALAYRALLRMVLLAFDIPTKDALAAAEDDARQALQMDPTLPYGHHCLANLAAARGDWERAAREYEVAVALEQEPHARVSRIYHLHLAVGHVRLSETESTAVDQYSSFQPLGLIAAALASIVAGRDSEARCHADRACALGWPRTNPVLQDIYFHLSLRERRFSEAAELLSSALGQAAREAGGTECIRLVYAALDAPAQRDAAIGALRAFLGRVRLENLSLSDHRRVLLWLVAMGAMDEAFQFAHASLDRFARLDTLGLFCTRGILWVQELKPLRSDPRFEHMLARLRLFDYWARHGAPDANVSAKPPLDGYGTRVRCEDTR